MHIHLGTINLIERCILNMCFYQPCKCSEIEFSPDLYFQAQALFIPSAEAHRAARVQVSRPNEVHHGNPRAKRFNSGGSNVYEGQNLLNERFLQLLNEKRLQALIAEVEAIFGNS